MKILRFKEFINEAWGERDTMGDYYKSLKQAHPRSGYVQEFIDKIQELIDGKKQEYPRSDFRLKMGEQWGLEFIDSLVDHGRLAKVKKGRKEFIVGINSKAAEAKRISDFNNTFYEDIKQKENWGGNFNGIRFNYDDKKQIMNFTISEHVGTWHHYEKGHGETISTTDQKKAEEEIEENLTGWYIVKKAMEEFKENLGSAKFKITKRDKGQVKTFHHDGHKGYLYTVSAVVTK
jgi:hypothetical protein